AGFPSLVLASAFPSLRITSVDSTNKKISFVNAAAEKLSLKNLQGVHARGNELARKAPYRENYDIVTARAVASADILVKEGFSFLKKSGVLAIYRTGTQLQEETAFLNKNKKFSWQATELFSLPEDAGMRQFLLMEKKG
ncbi:MAG: class I SAM-dependent methyltransferase, partial [Lentisphaeria bacterium]|nr:class I SAM-dependent methyltransferase [Lentisphaeria bacterium]